MEKEENKDTNKEEKTEITTYNYPSCEEKDVSEIYSMAMHSTTVKTELLKKGGVSITEHCFYTDFEFIMKSQLCLFHKIIRRISIK